MRGVDDSDVITALFEAFGKRDVEAALALSDDEIEFWPQVIMHARGPHGALPRA